MALAERRVAVACQGGGSHTAFTAGVLRRLLADEAARRRAGYRMTGFSGTSGGAICALLAWYGVVKGDPALGAALLERFWVANAASEPWDVALNAWTVGLSRLRDVVSMPELSPYAWPAWPTEQLRRLLTRHVNFADVAEHGARSPVMLLIGAVDVLSGEFRVFRNADVTVEAVLASAAVPTLFRAVRVGQRLYWDGLFSQNPPIADFVRDLDAADKPDEIWLVQINPTTCRREPRRPGQILDRRNELAGNLSLRQECGFIERVNEWIAKGYLPADRYKPITLRTIALDRELDVASKLDRTPAFLASLMAEGDRQATAFLAALGAS
jgi:NTE family protein